MLLRQYGLREYAVTLTVAALVGLGVAVLLNSAAGGGAETPAELTLRSAERPAPAGPSFAVANLRKPRLVAKAAPARTNRKRRARPRPAPAPAPAPSPAPQSERLVATRTPAPQPTYTPPPAPKPAPVVHKPAPAPAPKPAPAPAPKPSGGGQFDDSG